MLFHDAVANAEAESRSFSYCLRGVERIENATRILYSWPIVGKLDTELIPGDGGANPDFTSPAFSLDRTVFLNCIHRVVQNVQKNLLELVEVATCAREVRIEFAMNLDVVQLHVVFAQDQRVVENLVELNRRALRLVLARKAEEILDDMMRALSLLVELFEIVGPARSDVLFGFQELAVAENRGERIVQLVSHP